MPSTPPSATHTPLTRVILGTSALFAAIFALSASMALITPVYAGMDERAHTTYGLAVIHGEIPVHEQVPNVDEWVSSTSEMCWINDVSTPSQCMAPMSTSTEQVDEATTASNYPPLYYALVFWPSFFLSGSHAFYAIRLASAFLFALLASIGIASVGIMRGKSLLSMMALFVVSPSAHVLGGLINPQSLEIGATIASAGLLIPLLDSSANTSRRLVWAGICIFAWIQARPVGPWWALIFCFLLILALGMRRIRELLRLRAFWAFLTLAALSSTLWLIWHNIAPTRLAEAPYICGPGCSLTTMLFNNDLMHTIATTGALNVQPPMATALPYIAAILGIYALSFATLERRERFALLVGLACIPLSILLIQINVGHDAGVMWQGRYGLPLEIPLAMLATFFLAERSSLPRRAFGQFAIFTSITYMLCFTAFAFFASVRFWNGQRWPDLFPIDITLFPPRVILCTALVALICALALGATALLVRQNNRTEAPASAVTPPPQG